MGLAIHIYYIECSEASVSPKAFLSTFLLPCLRFSLPLHQTILFFNETIDHYLRLTALCLRHDGTRGIRRKPDVQMDPLDSLTYNIELQSSLSKGKTPLWLNANKYGMSSLDKSNGYMRARVYRPLTVDDEHKFGLGYGVDVAVPYNYTSHFVLQQAYVEGRWLKGTLTLGAKEEPMAMKNPYLSSGAQTLGINSSCAWRAPRLA